MILSILSRASVLTAAPLCDAATTMLHLECSVLWVISSLDFAPNISFRIMPKVLPWSHQTITHFATWFKVIGLGCGCKKGLPSSHPTPSPRHSCRFASLLDILASFSCSFFIVAVCHLIGSKLNI